MAPRGPSYPLLEMTTTPGDAVKWGMALDLKTRAQKLIRMLPYAIALDLKESILARLPPGSETKDIVSGLRISEIEGGAPGRVAAFATHVPTRRRPLDSKDADSTLLFVRAKRRQGRKDPVIEYLVAHSPWTMETIPVWPSKKNAIVVERRASARQVQELGRLKERTFPQMRTELLRRGVQVPARRDSARKIPKNAKAVTDLVMLALDLEFGAPGRKPAPAWRGAIQEVLGTKLNGLPRRYRAIRDVLTNASSREWERWPGRIRPMRLAEAMSFAEFQKKLFSNARR